MIICLHPHFHFSYHLELTAQLCTLPAPAVKTLLILKYAFSSLIKLLACSHMQAVFQSGMKRSFILDMSRSTGQVQSLVHTFFRTVQDYCWYVCCTEQLLMQYLILLLLPCMCLRLSKFHHKCLARL